MSHAVDQDEAHELKKKMASEGPKLKKEFDRPGKLMVSGIPQDAQYTKEQLEAEFSVFGPILDVSIIRKGATGIPKGFAFVTFKNPADAEKATAAVEGKDIGGSNPLHCERAVIGFIKQSQLASSQKRGMQMGGRGGRGAPWMDRGRGRGGMERGGFRGMRGGGPPTRGMRGRGGGPGRYMGGEDMYYGGEEDYYGRGEEEYYGEDAYNGSYPERSRGGPRGRPPSRGMRGGPPGMRGGHGGPPSRGGYPMGRGGPADRGAGGPLKRPLLPSPPEAARGRGGAMRGRGHGPPPAPRGPPAAQYPPQSYGGEEYYGEEEPEYKEDYGGNGAEDYYEEDPYNAAEEDPYSRAPEGGYYGVPEPPASRGRGAPPVRGRAPPGARGAASAPARAADGGGAPRRAPMVDEYGYPIEQAPAEPQPRQRAPVAHKPEGAYRDEYYGEGDRGAMPPSKDPYARQRAAPGPGRAPAPTRRPTDPYAEDPYGMYGGGERAKPEGKREMDPYEGSYGANPHAASSASSRRGAAPVSQSRMAREPVSRPRQAEYTGYSDSDYVGQGAGGTDRSGSRYQDEYRGQGPSREMHREERRSTYSRRDDPYMDQRVASETDAYMSYPSSSRLESRESMARKRPIDPYSYEMADSRRDYDDYRGNSMAAKRESMSICSFSGSTGTTRPTPLGRREHTEGYEAFVRDRFAPGSTPSSYVTTENFQIHL